MMNSDHRMCPAIFFTVPVEQLSANMLRLGIISTNISASLLKSYQVSYSDSYTVFPFTLRAAV